jgi:hypothetical protein
MKCWYSYIGILVNKIACPKINNWILWVIYMNITRMCWCEQTWLNWLIHCTVKVTIGLWICLAHLFGSSNDETFLHCLPDFSCIFSAFFGARVLLTLGVNNIDSCGFISFIYYSYKCLDHGLSSGTKGILIIGISVYYRRGTHSTIVPYSSITALSGMR